MTPADSTKRAAFLAGKLLQLQNRKAELQAERNSVSDRLHSNQNRLYSNVFQGSVLSALRHRLNRLPILVEQIDREIAQAQADIEHHALWHSAVRGDRL